MSVRRLTVVLSSLLLVGTACARLLPSSNRDEPRVRSARPHIDKTATRAREGSDLTLPREPESNWPVRVLAPCDSTAPKTPGGTDCRGEEQRVDTLRRAPIDTATKKRP
jgi:hypothetical protein